MIAAIFDIDPHHVVVTNNKKQQHRQQHKQQQQQSLTNSNSISNSETLSQTLCRVDVTFIVANAFPFISEQAAKLVNNHRSLKFICKVAFLARNLHPRLKIPNCCLSVLNLKTSSPKFVTQSITGITMQNPIIGNGLRQYSKRAFAKRTRLYLAKQKKVTTAPKAAPAPVVREATIKGGKKVQLKEKTAKYAPVETSEVRAVARQYKQSPVALRKTITPGTVLIIVAGRYAGKRVVFLKQLTSGLLLITGPFRLNGVPLRRIDQRYVIATSTKVNVANVKVPESVNDCYFKAEKKAATTKKAEGEFFKDGEKKTTEKAAKKLPEVRIADQKAVDTAILAALKGQKELVLYLKTAFGLRKGEFPHALKF
ncbi:60S ribosomal protein L6 [Heterostelium album PN500]|uniref:60S ribosomal protein L6 n=1 Tax=Heterostelium pallidum (strain ATCC 26659 / Pp 5 / PN500) TaxID=670386 RepID=D3BH46_HETP5|nr:60S ribosomal protein L6 [Heterostelium album PN500]EFA79430.1 60S ribosomal protein L6 [Heterostelium album PN500]|eukprot:XP_020431551.1 60S ribosomal protein L6 [Heterostelium album PN500]